MKSSKSTYNILLDPLPDEWQGVKIKTDFRQVLKFFVVVKDKELTDEERAYVILRLFFDVIPENEQVWEFIQFYINGGKYSEDEIKEDNNKVFDFTVDAGRIYSAFKQTYNIDLNNEKLHWFVFFELFQCLPSNTRFMEIVELRGKKTTKNDSAEYKKELRKLQRLYKIEDENEKPASMKSFFDMWRG